jgi:hypothetical protein
MSRESYQVFSQGLQRITATAMAENKAEAGLYYFDVEIVSEGTGDKYNIAAANQLSVDGYKSDGYFLTTADRNLTFSTTEDVRLVLSKSILEQGVDDDPANATQLSGQNLQITYDRSSLVGDAQNFVSSELERVVCSSPLSRHLIPHFVRFDLTYSSGSKEDVVIDDLEQHIRDLFPTEALEVSDIEKIVMDRGADSIRNPLDLIAVVYGIDREVLATRSQDSLSTGRLAAFFPELLNIKRNVS